LKNPQVGPGEAAEINKAVSRLLSEFKGLEPPIDLDMVRDRLKLDREYYSSKDPSRMKEVVHALKVAGKNVLADPMLLGRAIVKMDLKSLFFWDQKRILIDIELPKLKHRWAEGHEIGHSLTWWHKDYLLGDSDNELSLACHATIEAEANYAGGQLLFLQDRFIEEAMSRPVTMETIKILKGIFGNTWTSTLWRFIEQYRGPEPLVGVVSVHPKYLPEDFNSSQPCRYVIQSPKFREMFSSVDERTLFSKIQSYCGSQKGGPLGNAELLLVDDNGNEHNFDFHTHSNTYQALTIGSYLRPVRVRVAT